ncbi:MAG: fumarylacetoacetate hydrolase family protein [Gemmataceae bacterium]
MPFAKYRRPDGSAGVAYIEAGIAHPLRPDGSPDRLSELLQVADPVRTAKALIDPSQPAMAADRLEWLAPVDRQEIWAAGVTYKRSKVAREEESKGAAAFYDAVYTAPRPELFLKSTPDRVVHPHRPIRVRADSKWNVPEPELALVISPDLRIVGYTIGNDVSSRDIEGENPLYLPQAKIYRGACSIGPVITSAHEMKAGAETGIKLVVKRAGQIAFEGTTNIGMMARSLESLVEWLGKELDFPNGAILLTGTGIVPPDSFNLSPNDTVEITIDGIGTLVNKVTA